MNTFPKTSILSEIAENKPVPAEKLAYFQARLQARLYNFVMARFKKAQDEEGLTRAELARRIGKKPEVITRLLGAPGNWQLSTASDLLIGIAGEEMEMSSSSLLRRSPRNFALPVWAAEQIKPPATNVIRNDWQHHIEPKPRSNAIPHLGEAA